MSVYTTLYVTKGKAMEIYLREKFSIDDKELERFMDEYLAPSLYNVLLVENDHKNDDDLVY